MPDDKIKRMTLRLNNDLDQWLDSEAKRLNISKHAVINVYLYEQMEKRIKQQEE